MLRYIQHYGHIIIFRKKPVSQIPYCMVCKNNLTEDEVEKVKG